MPMPIRRTSPEQRLMRIPSWVDKSLKYVATTYIVNGIVYSSDDLIETYHDGLRKFGLRDGNVNTALSWVYTPQGSTLWSLVYSFSSGYWPADLILEIENQKDIMAIRRIDHPKPEYF